MSSTQYKNISSAVLQMQQQISQEEKNYLDALKRDLPFCILKEIKNKIKRLNEQLNALLDHC